MNITEMMNYRFENPKGNVNPDKEIAMKIAQNPNMTTERLEQASAWVSLTDNKEAIDIINARLDEIKYVNEEGFAKVA